MSVSIPTALGIASLAATAVSTGVSVAGSISSADAQSKSAAYTAQVARNNAITAEQNAQYATKAGQEKAAETALKAREQQGEVTTAIAANGLDVNSDTPGDIRTTQRETGTKAIQQTVDAAQLQAYGYRSNSSNFQAEADLQQAKAAQALTAGNWAATGTLIGGASSLADKYTKLNNSGALGGSSSNALGPQGDL